MSKLLIIDDEPDIVEGLKILSEILGKSATCHTEWAPELVLQHPEIDILILDLHLPGFDGFDAFKDLANTGFDKPIILISGMDPSVINASIKVAREKGLNAVLGLQKPFGLEDFSSALNSAEQSQPMQALQAKPSAEKTEESLPDIIECMEKDYFSLVYQPQVNPFNDQVVGIECLSRLNHPEHGFIPPPVFIQLLEDKDLISQFTLAMMDKALRELTPLFQAGKHMAVSFNVSALSLNEEFKRDLLATVNRHPIPTRFLTLEITETSALNIQSESISVLTDFRIKGFNLSLDDFGTGYSTIRQLNELPFNEIKVDRCFIKDIGVKKSAEAIIAATVELADNINYMLVCEGIETQEQLEFLLNLNCAVYQGYLFSKPTYFEGLCEMLDKPANTSNDNAYWSKHNHISQQILNDNINFRCVNLGDAAQVPFQHLANIVGPGLEVKSEQLNTINWNDTELLIVAGARNIAQIQDIMKAVKGQVIVLYKHLNTKEMVQLFKMGVAEIIDAKTLPQELLYRIYMLAQQSRRLQRLESEYQQLEQRIITIPSAEQSTALMKYFSLVKSIKSPRNLLQQTVKFLASLNLDAVIQTQIGDQLVNIAASGPLDNALTIKVFDSLKSKGAMYRQHNRTIFNSPDVHLLILNSPGTDEGKLQLQEICEFVLFVLDSRLQIIAKQLEKKSDTAHSVAM